MSFIIFSPNNSHLLEVNVRANVDPDPFGLFKDQSEISLVFEEHSGMPGDELVLRLTSDELNHFVELLCLKLLQR